VVELDSIVAMKEDGPLTYHIDRAIEFKPAEIFPERELLSGGYPTGRASAPTAVCAGYLMLLGGDPAGACNKPSRSTRNITRSSNGSAIRSETLDTGAAIHARTIRDVHRRADARSA
jgi:hypothetical protein